MELTEAERNLQSTEGPPLYKFVFTGKLWIRTGRFILAHFLATSALRRCSDGVPIELERRHNVLPTIIALTAVQQVGLVEERQLVWLEHSRIFVSVHLK